VIRPPLHVLTLAGGVAASLAAGTALAAFWSRTASANDSFTAGTVYVTDDDGGNAMLSLSNAIPTQAGESDTSCIQVTYGGTLDASVRLYGTVSGALASYLTLRITRGTSSAPSFDSCATFTADTTNYNGAGPGVIFFGSLAGFPSTSAAAIVDPTGGTPETWSTNESHAYKFTVSLNDNVAAEGLTGSASFTWAAANL
jgi:hypothetical protein